MKIIPLFLLIASIDAQLKKKSTRIYIGSALEISVINKEPAYKKISIEQFNCLTPGNTQKWDAVEWTRGQYNYANADAAVKFAEENNMKVRGHTLVWHNQLPPWVQALEHNKTELHKAMVEHISQEVGHFKGKIYAWDVVNEAIGDNGGLRDSLWSRNFGNSFIADAFKAAHSVDPNAKLYINDFNVADKSQKSESLYNLTKQLLADGVPIHGVGLQGHFILGNVPGDLQENIQRFADLGVDVAITELDIRMKLPATPALLDQQARDFAHVYGACQAVNRCVGVTVWGFTDKASWILEFFPGYGAATLWDENYKPKPAVSAIEKILK